MCNLFTFFSSFLFVWCCVVLLRSCLNNGCWLFCVFLVLYHWVNLENWVLGNYVATLQLLVFFAEVAHEAFFIVFVCLHFYLCFRWFRVYGCVQVRLHTLGGCSVHKIIS